MFTGAELSPGHSFPASRVLPAPSCSHPWDCPPKFTMRGMSLPRPPLLHPHLRAPDLCPTEETQVLGGPLPTWVQEPLLFSQERNCLDGS